MTEHMNEPLRRRSRRVPSASVLAVGAFVALTACTGGDAPSPYDGEIGSTDLSASCPDTVTVQVDWFPGAEEAHLYELFDASGEGADAVTVDADAKRVTGPLFDGDNGYTGVDLEIRSGGPAIGNQSVTSLMYQDPDIMLGYVNMDSAVQHSTDMPTVSVMSTLDKSPHMIMWDPETHPDVHAIEDLGDEGVDVLYFSDETYMKYLIGEGILDESQTDSSYDGSPSNFVASDGEKAQQGFSSTEPYQYEHEVEGWMRPVDYQLVHDTGFQTYKSTLAVKADQLETQSDCLRGLVPVFQRGLADYMDTPEDTNSFIVDVVDQFNAGWIYGVDIADYGATTMRDEGLVANGTDGTLGSFDGSRVSTLVDQLGPIFAVQGTPVAHGLISEDLYTNEFLDTAVTLRKR
ncbi:ABC transporter substrate-binding protein [Corynebacterium glyciniphilum]|uniref:ABC-type nitrate/sulfonate/bicarbonate transport transporter, substrate-binding lipoprotein n=1 Tax=Corynebacterium glyciniphilum AJ 3170 TaxID=1404245 RepID=X5DTL7_9CORY|nr:ABC transporter substrate-binding protein [Corynebacterium glyciniphilum]AHW64624.1 ABC-type nitrate/sulfonate/bicarbonate transport transporter, substrate-binding lipoprotein [Corynebacterium glyciniphilum AJ 3170]